MTTADTLTAAPDAELLACEACPHVGTPDDFRAYTFGEYGVDDRICDECLAVQADAAAADESNRRAYYYR